MITNQQVYDAAYSGAWSGVRSAGRISSVSSPTAYAMTAAAIGLWATEFDTLWADATSLDEVQYGMINEGSYGVWSGRDANTALTLAECSRVITTIIGQITEAEAYFAAQIPPVVPLPWGGAPGGGVPLVPALSAGWALRSTGGPGPALANSVWEPDGGPAITSFTKSNGQTFELGNSDVNPVFAAAYNEAASAAQINYTGAVGSPLVLVAPYTAGTILHTFSSVVNAHTESFQLAATVAATPLTRTLLDTWGSPLLFDISASGGIVATQGFLDTMRADHAATIRTSMGGTYGTGLTVGAGAQFSFAAPSAFALASVTDPNGLVISPSVVGTIVGYTNPFGVVIPMTLYTFGGIATGILNPKGYTVS
jgi:hypothetical protein